jgi:hypothetical protein
MRVKGKAASLPLRALDPRNTFRQKIYQGFKDKKIHP